MRIITFAKRCFKEIVRDPINLIFCLGLPLFLLIIFQQFKIPSEVYKINNFAPGIIIFSFSFITLFASMLISKDRSTSLLSRLYSSPMKPIEFILGYTLSLLPVALLQSIIFIIVSLFLGLEFHLGIIFIFIIILPLSLLFINLGILVGCLFNDKQSSAISSIVIQLVAFTSGMWFDTAQVGKLILFLSNILPFKYSLNLIRSFINNDYHDAILNIIVVSIYIIASFVLTIYIFNKKMMQDNK